MENVTTQKNVRIAVGVFGRTIIAALISIVLYLSISTVFTTLSTEKIGFAIWQTNEDGSTTLVAEHLYTDEDYTEEIELEEDQMVTTLYSSVTAGVALTADIITQIASLIVLAAFPYRRLWELGDGDRNNVNYGHQREDKWRGFKVGLLANIPAIAVYAVLWMGKLGVSGLGNMHALYAGFNSSFLPFCYRVMGRDLTSATRLSVSQLLLLVLPVLVLPLVCHVAYILGRHQFVLSDKVFYRHKKKRKSR